MTRFPMDGDFSDFTCSVKCFGRLCAISPVTPALPPPVDLESGGRVAVWYAVLVLAWLTTGVGAAAGDIAGFGLIGTGVLVG